MGYLSPSGSTRHPLPGGILFATDGDSAVLLDCRRIHCPGYAKIQPNHVVGTGLS